MRRRDFLCAAGSLATFAFQSRVFGTVSLPTTIGKKPTGKMIGMYIHQHWPYKHPYAARTWTVEDYRGYADGLKTLGYNMIMIWPILETMPDPLTPSDGVSLEKLRKVVDILHRDFEMRVYIALCPNVVAKNEEAAKYSFEKRHFFYCDARVNPGDQAALARMIKRREELFRPLAQIDGVSIIDSDPGGYAGSTNAEFVNLLAEHRKMLDRIRPDIEMYYWMHVGWEAYSRYYQTGRFKWGTPAEAEDVLTRLKKVDPKPWGITVHTVDVPPNGTDLNLAKTVGLASTALAFNYGAIEGEPSFPMTNFGDNNAFRVGQSLAPRGTIANAQTHCVQLPNTFAFARGALGNSLPMEADYVQFADGLIPGQGRLIAQGWEALSGKDTAAMRALADKMEALPKEKLTPGPLKGLLFGDPQRFVTDLVMELRLKAAYSDFVLASENDRDSGETFRHFVEAAAAWQSRNGYECAWVWPDLEKELRKLKSTAINMVLDEKAQGSTPFDRVADELRTMETYTLRLIEAMKKTSTVHTG